MKIYTETERLILREITLDDLDDMFEMDSDPDVHRYLGNTPVTSKEQMTGIIQFIRKQYAENGIGRWAVIDKNSDEFLGWSGLKLVTEPVNNHINYYDLGYRLKKKYWGKRYAAESAKASLDYAFSILKTDQVYAMADCENIASNKILSKIGFQLVERFQFDDADHYWYCCVNGLQT